MFDIRELVVSVNKNQYIYESTYLFKRTIGDNRYFSEVQFRFSVSL
ncbi:hypothetical protein SAU060112_40558 [Staphylococcus aureus]|nr:hypothetical protein SAU060112_40558 [Staphylococcus aureus]